MKVIKFTRVTLVTLTAMSMFTLAYIIPQMRFDTLSFLSTEAASDNSIPVLQAELLSNKSSYLTWNAVEGAQSYRINKNGVFFGEVSTQELYDEDLMVSNRYNYSVRSVVDGVVSEGSNVVSLETCIDINAINVADINNLFAKVSSEQRVKTSDVVLSKDNFKSLGIESPLCLDLDGDKNLSDHTNLLNLATHAANVFEVPIYISGNLSVSSPIKLRSNTRIIGVDSHSSARITSSSPTSSILRIVEGANDVTLRDLTIQEVQEVSVALLMMDGKNTGTYVKRVNFLGSKLDPGMRTRGIFLAADWSRNTQITFSSFSDLEYGIHMFAPVYDFVAHKNEIERWSHYAILLGRSSRDKNYRTEGVDITHNHIHNAGSGGDLGVILVTRGPSYNYVKDVKIISNKIVGNGGSNKPGTPNQNAHGDQIVLHGVNGFQITANDVSYGGENAVSATRLARNGTISSNNLHHNDGNAIAIGSNYYELKVDTTKSFSIGDEIEGSVSGTKAKITTIFEDVSVIGIGSIRGAPFRVESVHNRTTGQNDVAKALITDRTKNIKILANDMRYNAIDSLNEVGSKNGALAGVLVSQSDAITFRRNVISDMALNDTRDFAIIASNSRNLIVDDTNSYEGELIIPTDRSKVLLNRSWLAQ